MFVVSFQFMKVIINRASKAIGAEITILVLVVL